METNQAEGSSKSSKKRVKLVKADKTLPEVNNSHLRCINNWPAVENVAQTSDFTVPIHKQFQRAHFPGGEFIPYKGLCIPSQEELQERKILNSSLFADIRRAAECHRQVRRYIQPLIRPAISTLEIVQLLESKSAELITLNGLESGYAFPTGVSIDNVAAHYTPNYGEDLLYLKHDSVCKVDYGVHVNGHIVDCAFTVAFDEKFDPLLQCTREATNHALKVCGPDLLLGELGAQIEEIISSYEITLNGKVYPCKPIENLSGHMIAPYRIHAKKSVPIVNTKDTDRMLENEVYAIETFATTGSGTVVEQGHCSHYMVDYDVAHSDYVPVDSPAARKLYAGIMKNFGTLAFCRRWLDDRSFTKHALSLSTLVRHGIVREYPPLVDRKNSYTSQFEHTVIMHNGFKEIVTRGDDY